MNDDEGLHIRIIRSTANCLRALRGGGQGVTLRKVPAALPGAVDGNRKFAFLPSDGRVPVGDTSSGPLEADR